MRYEFQATLYRTAKDMADAIAYEWMTAGGANDSAEIDAIIADGATAEALVDEAIDAWGLNMQAEDASQTWMEERDTDRADLVAAFAKFLAERPDREE